MAIKVKEFSFAREAAKQVIRWASIRRGTVYISVIDDCKCGYSGEILLIQRKMSVVCLPDPSRLVEARVDRIRIKSVCPGCGGTDHPLDIKLNWDDMTVDYEFFD